MIMAEWIPHKPYKAKPHEWKNNRKGDAKTCRICGKPTHRGGDTCKACLDFLRQKRREERNEE